jgi:two-component system cell cycle sensor histidine kinase/response regulator CckA
MHPDHSQFIARHHKHAAPPDFRQSRRRRLARPVAVVLFVLILAAGAAFVHYSQASPVYVLIALGIFTLALLAAWGVYRLIYGMSAREHERGVLRDVIEGSRGARLIIDSSDTVVYANQKFLDLCEGYGPPTYETLTRLFEQNEETLSHFRRLADKAHRGITDSLELCSFDDTKDIRETWYRVMAQPVGNWTGYIHWRIDDITERVMRERSIHEEREKLIDFTDNAPVGFFSVNERGHFIFANATLARWLGEDITTLLTTGRLHTYMDNPPEDAAPYDITSKGGVRQVAEVFMKGPAGSTFLASINQSVVIEDDGRVRTRGVLHDLTAEREMRQALRDSEDRFQRFFEEAPLGIALVDDKRVMTDCNTALAQMLGTSTKQLEGRVLDNLITGGNSNDLVAALSRIEAGEKMESPQEVRLQGNDQTVIANMYARKFKSSENIVLHFIDLTQQKNLEAQFVQSQKMQAIGQLAGGVAHDFNNLLTAITGFCDLLLIRHKPGDPSFGDIQQIKQNANRAANLVRQLLAFSRQQTLRPKVHDVTDILSEVSHLIRRLIGTNIELELFHGSDLGLVKVDEGQLEQVLINLAVNARDAMEEYGGGKLTITTNMYENETPMKTGEDTMPAGRWLAISLSDTGHGIAEEDMAHIFEPFFTTKSVGEGTGLGLATVYGIIRQTGGYLHVDSTLGEGTTFTIYLPALSEEEIAAEEEKDETQDEEEPHDLTGTARLMLVEDEDAVRSFSARALANKGYDVIEAGGGEEALEKARALDSGVDLLITDVMMPEVDGPTLARELQSDKPDLRVIFISGYTEEKLKDYMGENIWFLPKPFSLKQLAARVKEVLEE